MIKGNTLVVQISVVCSWQPGFLWPERWGYYLKAGGVWGAEQAKTIANDEKSVLIIMTVSIQHRFIKQLLRATLYYILKWEMDSTFKKNIEVSFTYRKIYPFYWDTIPLLLPPASGNHQPVFCLHSFTFSRTSLKWNHTACGLFHWPLTSLRVLPVSAAPSFLLLSPAYSYVAQCIHSPAEGYLGGFQVWVTMKELPEHLPVGFCVNSHFYFVG